MSSTIPVAPPQLDINGRNGRYGVAYLDALVTSVEDVLQLTRQED